MHRVNLLLHVFLISLIVWPAVGEKGVRLAGLHRRIKRQVAPTQGTFGFEDNANNAETLRIDSSQDSSDNSRMSNQGQPSRRRSFVGPNGQPYYEYRPPVSSSRGSSSHSILNSRLRPDLAIVDGSLRPRGQTYEYPFGGSHTARSTWHSQYSGSDHGATGTASGVRTTGERGQSRYFDSTNQEAAGHFVINEDRVPTRRSWNHQPFNQNSRSNQRNDFDYSQSVYTRTRQGQHPYRARLPYQSPSSAPTTSDTGHEYRPSGPTRQDLESGTNGHRRRQYYNPNRHRAVQIEASEYPQQGPWQHAGYWTATNQQGGYRSSANQRPGNRATTYRHIVPNQRASSRGYYQHTGQAVNPRFVAPTQRQTFSRVHDYSQTTGGGLGPNSQTNYNPFAVAADGCPETGVNLLINGLDCRQALDQHGSYLCYAHEYTSRMCCQLCRGRKQVSRTGCEYGDHIELCREIQAADCYDLRTRQSCCDTCERLRRNDMPAGCEYGDMTIRCEAVRQSPGLCYIPDNQRLCCDTCRLIRNETNQGCPWGDYDPSMCQMFEENSSSVRINCYSQHRRRICCQSCERLREWVPDDLPSDCQYGDRPVVFNTEQFGRLNCSTVLTHFGVRVCQTNPMVSLNCCHTCYRHRNNRG